MPSSPSPSYFPPPSRQELFFSLQPRTSPSCNGSTTSQAGISSFLASIPIPSGPVPPGHWPGGSSGAVFGKSAASRLQSVTFGSGRRVADRHRRAACATPSKTVPGVKYLALANRSHSHGLRCLRPEPRHRRQRQRAAFPLGKAPGRTAFRLTSARIPLQRFPGERAATCGKRRKYAVMRVCPLGRSRQYGPSALSHYKQATSFCKVTAASRSDRNLGAVGR